MKCDQSSPLSAGLRAWYEQSLGRSLAHAEQLELDRILPTLFGYHLLQVGAGDHSLLSASRILHKVSMSLDASIVDPSVNLCGDPVALPIQSDCIDAVILHHALELAQDPRQLLRESERILVPEGHLVIMGFNPHSLWGLRKFLGFRSRSLPWCGRFLSVFRVKDWLALLGFEIVNTRHLFFRPPFKRMGLLRRLSFLEGWGARAWPIFGGVYIMVARKKVSTVTPIRPRWRPRRRLVAGLTDAASRSYERHGGR